MVSKALGLLNDRLTHFLSNKLKWTDLNEIQKKAIPEIIGSNDTLVIAPTASGKTEAVLIPIFSQLLDNNPEPMSVLYISPLKALINDMYDRIDLWGSYFNFTTTKWHGDVSKAAKNSFLNNPTDFLLITPESLEVIFMNKSKGEKEKIFKNIKYVIIDEIHYFAESDRGIQLNSLLNRISEYTLERPIKVGLSATVGNPEDVSKWINFEHPAKIIKTEGIRKFKYKLWSADIGETLKRFKKYEGKKVLIFVNSRASAEKYFQLMENMGFQNIFLHHSSIGKYDREEYERKFKECSFGFMISTSTLELGIDIGNIDMVIQIDPPNNMSSLLQRVGRSGRRSKVQRSIIISNDFDVFVSLAEIILIGEDLIENIKIPTNAKDIFFHQILSSIFEVGKLDYNKLYDNLTSCYVFSDISKDDYYSLLSDMREKDFIEKSQNFISLGYNFEKEFGKYNFSEFYGVFLPNIEYSVREGHKEIGTVDVSFAVILRKDSSFVLGGKLWMVESIDPAKFRIQVKRSKIKSSIPNWGGFGPSLSYLISRKVYDVLLGNFNHDLLYTADKNFIKYLEKGLSKAKECNFIEGVIPIEFDSESNQINIFTFAGKNANNLLVLIFQFYYEVFNIEVTNFYVSFKVKDGLSFNDVENIIYDIENIIKSDTFNVSIAPFLENYQKNKFVDYLPLEDEVDIKLNSVFDYKNLIDLIANNSLIEVYDVNFDKWYENKKNNK